MQDSNLDIQREKKTMAVLYLLLHLIHRFTLIYFFFPTFMLFAYCFTTFECLCDYFSGEENPGEQIPSHF